MTLDPFSSFLQFFFHIHTILSPLHPQISLHFPVLIIPVGYSYFYYESI